MHPGFLAALPSPRTRTPRTGNSDDEEGVSPGRRKRQQDGPQTPRGVCDVDVCKWAWTARVSPLQATVRLSPAGFLVWILWIATLFFTVDRMIPVETLSESVEGMHQFASQVSFKKLDGSTGKLADVATMDDVVAYEQALIGALLPSRSYGGGDASDGPYVLKVHRLLDHILVAQRRVGGRECAYPEMQTLYPECYGELSPETELTADFEKSGRVHKYDPALQAYVVELPLDGERASKGFEELMGERFWDRGTRSTSVRFAIHNAPGHYSGYGFVEFKLSPYGLVTHDVVLDFLRLKPYAPEVDGSELLYTQVACCCLLGVLAVLFLYNACMQPHKRWTLAYMLRPWACADYLVFWLAYECVLTWHTFIDSPQRASLENFGTSKTDGFRAIAQLCGLFQRANFFLSMLLLFSTLRLLEYMVLVRQLRTTYVAVSNAMIEIGWFGIMFLVLFGGFVLSGHVLFGAHHPFFKDLGSTASNLMLWLLTFGGGQYRVLELPGGWLYLPLFLFVCLVLIFNILLALLLGSFEKEEEEEAMLKPGVKPWHMRPVNHRMADFICDSVGVEPFHTDPYIKGPPDVKTPLSVDVRTPASESSPLLQP